MGESRRDNQNYLYMKGSRYLRWEVSAIHVQSTDIAVELLGNREPNDEVGYFIDLICSEVGVKK